MFFFYEFLFFICRKSKFVPILYNVFFVLPESTYPSKVGAPCKRVTSPKRLIIPKKRGSLRSDSLVEREKLYETAGNSTKFIRLKYFDRLAATASLKVLDFQCLKVLGSIRMSLRLCKILVRFLTFMLFSGHVRICFTLLTAAVFAFLHYLKFI